MRTIISFVILTAFLFIKTPYAQPAYLQQTLRLQVGSQDDIKRKEELEKELSLKKETVYIAKEIEGQQVIIAELPKALALAKDIVDYVDEKGDLQYADEAIKGLEFIDILEVGEGGNENVVGRVLRKKKISDLGHEKGLLHRTSNAFVLNLDGEIIIDRRAHNKAQPLKLSILGGHNPSGWRYRQTIRKELPEKLGFPEEWKLQGRLWQIGEEGGFKSPSEDKKNNERRSLYVYLLSDVEYGMIKQDKMEMDRKREEMTRKEWQEHLEQEQADLEKPGAGEVWTRYIFDMKSLLNAKKESAGLYVELQGDRFLDSKGNEQQRVSFTSDLLEPLLTNSGVINEVKAIIEHVKENMRPDFFYDDLQEVEGKLYDIDKTLLEMLKRQAKEGFGYDDYWEEGLTIEEMYRKHATNKSIRKEYDARIGQEDKSAKVTDEKPLGRFSLIKSIWRPLRRVGFPGTKLKDHPEAVNDGCFICIPNMANQQRGLRIFDKINGVEYVALANPFQYLKNHITLALIGHEDQGLSLGRIGFMLDLIERLKSFSFSFNAIGAAASIPKHLHFHGTNGKLPLEGEHIGEITLFKSDRLKVSKLDESWPNLVYVIRGDKEKIARFLIGMIDSTAERFPGEDQQEKRAFGILFGRDAEGQRKVYLIPRRKERPSNFGNDFGFCEMGGRLICETTEDFEDTESPEPIEKALRECGYPHKDADEIESIFKDVIESLRTPIEISVKVRNQI
ncbi:MAG: DUF4922 domain-containing protein [Candidatus Gorgyraea atricola]|nr:DUF4922 domain-containing protein [Candidatus Gorgyraea atricola]